MKRVLSFSIILVFFFATSCEVEEVEPSAKPDLPGSKAPEEGTVMVGDDDADDRP